jgi:hypothetical protein
MKLFKYLSAAIMVAALSACGGGGGAATSASGTDTTSGTGGTTGTGTTTPVAVSTLTLALLDSTGAATTSVSASGFVSAKATLKDASGAVVAGTKVTFSGDVALVKISPASSVLTDSSGVATVQISSASLSAAGAGTLSASANVAGTALDSNIDFQLSPANLTLMPLDVGSGSLAAYGNRPISVVAKINGVIATNTPVQVTFTAACGSVKPETATTDGTGKASVTYTADSANCAGTNVKITASSVGVASPQENNISVAAVQATNLQFLSAVPELIYLLNSGATTQSLVTFKVVDSTGNPVQNQKVNLGLLNANLAAGLSIDTLGNGTDVPKTTDQLGLVTVAVFSGDVPTSVQVTAKLDAPSTVKTNSNILTVASGKPVQKAASLSLEKFSIEGFDVDGATSDVIFSMADRQGNPVPDGTEVNMVAESGVLIPARCVVTGGTSQCKSNYRTSGTRPANGRVSIMAYVPGEEDFVDANYNNKYDPNEKFTDMGNAYRDDDENLAFTLGEFSVPRAGGQACNPAGFSPNQGDGTGLPGENGRPGTCDGVWGTNEVRKQIVIVVATGRAIITPISIVRTNLSVSVTDLIGNSMPTGTTIEAEKLSGSDNCTVKNVLPAVIANRYGAQTVGINLDKCLAGDKVSVTVTSPKGIGTFLTITLK